MDNNEKRKNEIVSKLQTIYSCAKLKPHECEWILQAIEYIRKIANEQARRGTIRVRARVCGLHGHVGNCESDICIGDEE